MVEDECLRPPHDSWVGSFTYYITGCGHLNNSITVEFVEECYPCEHLIYFKKGEEIWGEPLAIQSSRVEANTIYLYPNPAKDRIVITSQVEISQISLFNSIGQHFVIRSNIHSNVSEFSITDFPIGIYIVLIETKPGNKEIKRLLIE